MAALSTSTYGVTPAAAMADGYDLLVVRIKPGTIIDGAVVALCPDPDDDAIVIADVCIDGPPVP
jgi:hypothetical protein